MAYTLVNNWGTEFAVDWGVVERLCLSYWRSCHQYDYAAEVKMSESTWYNPFSWSLPSIRTVEVPWDKVRGAAEVSCARDMADYRRSAPKDMRGVALDVKWKVEQTAVNRRLFQTYLKDVQSTNMAEIQKSVDDFAGLVDAARFVRDASADVVAIGSTIATGGAAADSWARVPLSRAGASTRTRAASAPRRSMARAASCSAPSRSAARSSRPAANTP